MANSRKTSDVPGYQGRPGFLASRNTEAPNETTERYPQSVAPGGPPKRAEVEARLKATSESISSRLDAIQSEMGFSVDAAKSLAAKPLVSVALAAAAGFFIGRLLGSRGITRETGRSALVDLLAEAALSAQDADKPVDEAIDRVLAATDFGESDPPESGGFVRVVGLLALRSILRQVVSEVAARFTNGKAESDPFGPVGEGSGAPAEPPG